MLTEEPGAVITQGIMGSMLGDSVFLKYKPQPHVHTGD